MTCQKYYVRIKSRARERDGVAKIPWNKSISNVSIRQFNYVMGLMGKRILNERNALLAVNIAAPLELLNARFEVENAYDRLSAPSCKEIEYKLI
ncbi:hypothetical protein SADUNF_Sadunf06G0127200 [Salix dunnii]|uniref:Uncharacterized protein n=1 Tax=Salix dunnii TaxID=1413687 RepID=A0A835N0R6_9ROSI|nr:hypothetical protein SADUNF_Sadunf06G0127200 [Salix dunnii]